MRHLFLFALLTVFLSSCGGGNTSTETEGGTEVSVGSTDTPETTDESVPSAADTIAYTYQTDSISGTREYRINGEHMVSHYGESSFTYPVLKGTDDPVTEWLAAEITQMGHAMRHDCEIEIPEKNEVVEASSEEEIEEMRPAGMPNHSFSGNIRISRQTQGIVFIEEKTYCYAGGAHGMPYRRLSNYDLYNKKRLSLQDVFNTAGDFRQALTVSAYAELQKQLGEGLQATREEFEKSPALLENFALLEKGISIQFQAYDVAPYALGMPEVLIPYTELQSLMKPEIFDRVVGGN